MTKKYLVCKRCEVIVVADVNIQGDRLLPTLHILNLKPSHQQPGRCNIFFGLSNKLTTVQYPGFLISYIITIVFWKIKFQKLKRKYYQIGFTMNKFERH